MGHSFFSRYHCLMHCNQKYMENVKLTIFKYLPMRHFFQIQYNISLTLSWKVMFTLQHFGCARLHLLVTNSTWILFLVVDLWCCTTTHPVGHQRQRLKSLRILLEKYRYNYDKYVCTNIKNSPFSLKSVSFTWFPLFRTEKILGTFPLFFSIFPVFFNVLFFS